VSDSDATEWCERGLFALTLVLAFRTLMHTVLGGETNMSLFGPNGWSGFVILLSMCLSVQGMAQWVVQPVPAEFSILLSIGFSSADMGVTGGYSLHGRFNGGALYTSNGGTTWELARVPDSARALLSVQMFGDGTGYFVGAYNVPSMRRKISAIVPASRLARSGASARVDRLQRIGMDGSEMYRGLFLRTTDAGRTWVSRGTLPESTYYVISLAFLDSATGCITTSMTYSPGKAGILKTMDGGTTWARCVVPDSVADLASIRFVDSTLGFAAGYRMTGSVASGVILRTTDGGGNWTSMGFPTVDNFTDVRCTDSLTVFVTGVTPTGDGVVYRTTNGGVGWSLLPVGPRSTLLQGVCFAPGGQTGIMYGSTVADPPWLAVTLTTTDGGGQWKQSLLPGGEGAFLVDGLLLDERNGYLVGGDTSGQAVMFRTTNGGVMAVAGGNVEDPTKYSLMQNYPNPFNPSTSIGYVLPDRSDVSLVVFNTLGQRVATLQDGEQDAGYHEVQFNASDLPSGVYFYRLQVRTLDPAEGGVRTLDPVPGRDSRDGVGSYTETKKCLVMR